MATHSKLSYLKRYMSKEDLEELKMKKKMKKKVLSDIEKRQHGELADKSSLVKKPKESLHTSTKRPRHDSDSDHSPPKNNRYRHDSDSDQSPLRQNTASITRHDSDSDQSPVRKKPTSQHSRHHSDSDQSPVRRKPASQHSSHDVDSDQSPPRRNTHHSDSDQSPPRLRNPVAMSLSSNSTGVRHSDPSRVPDLSPPREKKKSSSSSGAKASKTLSGATAGLSSAAEMKREAKRIKEKEDRSFQQMDSDVLGRNAKTVMRDKETGRRRNMEAEKEANQEEQKKKEEQEKKYEQWGKGLSQQQEKEKRLADQVHEASKPLARYQDDEDLDRMLRQQDRAEDPMLAFIRKRKEKEDARNGKQAQAKKELPKYKGSAPPPPNRFNILPGYRWDGVDRSNGFESKLFASINNKKAVQEMAYKWSTEDM